MLITIWYLFSYHDERIYGTKNMMSIGDAVLWSRLVRLFAYIRVCMHVRMYVYSLFDFHTHINANLRSIHTAV